VNKLYYFHGGNRHGKATALITALESHGWHDAPALKSNAIFVDSDTDKQFLNTMYQRGKNIFMYPHAGSPNLINDFEHYPISPFIKAGFVSAQGHLEIQRIIGIDYPLEVMGWHLCETRPFQKRDSYRNVLFAPIHPNADGTLSEINQKINKDTFEKLSPLVQSGEIDLTVRFIGNSKDNGLSTFENGIRWMNVKPEIDTKQIDTKQIDEADIVIGHQTFAYLAVARGIPTLMMGENIAPRLGSERLKDFQWSKSWSHYKNILEYPHDILQDVDTLNLFRAVIAGDPYTNDWRERMIGKPFNPDYFVARVESYL